MNYIGWNIIGYRGKMICGFCKSDMSDPKNVEFIEDDKEDGKMIRKCKCGKSYMEMDKEIYMNSLKSDK